MVLLGHVGASEHLTSPLTRRRSCVAVASVSAHHPRLLQTARASLALFVASVLDGGLYWGCLLVFLEMQVYLGPLHALLYGLGLESLNRSLHVRG